MFELSERRIFWITWILLFIITMLGMAIDLVSPSLPSIAQSLKISSASAKNVISFYLLGYGLGNFLGGVMTDSLGRRQLLLWSLFGFTIASLLPVFYPHIHSLFLARILQGLTLGMASVVTRAVLADIYPKDKLTKLGTLTGTMFGLGPIIGPFLGGYLQQYFGWQACFIFFAVSIAIELAFIFFIVPETIVNKHPFCVVSIKRNLLEVMRHREFMTIIVMMGLIYSLLVSFNIVGPFLVQTRYHYSAVSFGYFSLCMGLFFLCATFICRYLLSKYHVRQLYAVFLKILLILTFIYMLSVYFFPTSLLFFLLVSSAMFFTCGFMFPMSLGYGLSFFRHIAGTAAAMMYLVNISICSLVGFFVSLLKIESNISAIGIYFSLIVLIFFVHSRLTVHKFDDVIKLIKKQET